MRRLTRLTLAFSKKRENFEAAVGLHFAYYNFVKRHNTLRCTPAMAAGVERDFWTCRRSSGGGRLSAYLESYATLSGACMALKLHTSRACP